MLKKWFYASASVLMLALAYHLGATNARGQVGASVAAAVLYIHGSFAVSSTGDVYFATYSETGAGAHWSRIGKVGASAPIVAIEDVVENYCHAVALDGSFYVSTDAGRTWQLMGNVFGGPTVVGPETMGALKARYRR